MHTSDIAKDEKSGPGTCAYYSCICAATTKTLEKTEALDHFFSPLLHLVYYSLSPMFHSFFF